MNSIAPESWYPDPTRRHQLRYWDGTAWTQYAADNGVQSLDPISVPQGPAVPLTRREIRKQEKSARAAQARAEQAAVAERKRVESERAAAERAAHQQAARERARAALLAREEKRLRDEAKARAVLEAEERELREARALEARALALPPYFLPEDNG